MKEIYVVNCCRTAVGSFGGSLKDTPAPELGAVVVKEALSRAGVEPEQVDELMFGCILTAAQGQNPARQVGVKAGLPYSVPAYTVGMVCGSGMKSVIEGARAILAGDADIIVAGGTENMSAAPYALLCALAHGDEESRRLSPLVARAVEAIRDNYMALYGVEELSAQLGVSKCHLVRVFSSEMGMPPGRFLTSVRIEAAKLLLAEREYSLEMIAGLCGFSGANYLCRVFKRETGLSPAAWRETAAHKAVVQKLPARNNEIYV